MFQNVLGALAGKDGSKTKVKGKVVLMAKNMLDFTDAGASLINNVNELLGKQVHLQLISSVTNSPGKLGGIVGHPAYLSNWITTIVPLTPGDATYHITFDWDNDLGVPGAFLIKNNHDTQFFLKTVTLDDVPGHGRLHFVCNSWVYPAYRYKSDRIFFANQAYLPSETPAPLKLYRDSELVNLRGTGTGMLEEWDRVYDYDTYNDLGEPNARPILGGSSEYPYPRRGRTGRAPHKTDPEFESRLPLLLSLNIYVPRDERFNHIKFSDNLANGLKSIVQFLLPEFVELFDQTPGEFDSFQDVLNLYQNGIKLPTGPLLDQIRDNMPFELLRQFLQPDGQGLVAKFPVPQVIKDDKWAWRTDEEFAREMLAGVNPVCIQRLTEFPPTSGLDPKVYGNQNSSIAKNHIETKLDGLTVDEAIMKNRLFMLDHHDTLIPYLRRINSTSTKMYATRTILFLQTDGTLKPLAIELSLPNPNGDGLGAINKIFTPCENGVEGTIWQLAKAFVAVNDYGVHQLISHWLNTHAIMEPFVIATNRQLSVLHPIHKLLQPHFRDTMNINATARQILVNEDGILEKVVFPGKYAMEMSAFVYKSWVFTDQALPADLIKRGMAVKDLNSPHGIKLLLEDYPYAVDGLKIWAAIEKWVKDYVEFYYKSDQIVQNDPEIQAWWKEVVEVGHGDLKSQPWWPKMQTKKELINSVTIIIWIASALHAAVNFGQYPYAGYLPNRPSVSRRFMPELGTAEYAELEANPEKAFFRTITPQLETLLGMSLIEILSRHASDEVYIGQRDTPEWTKDATPLAAFGAFEKKLGEIEKEIVAMNKDGKWKNRSGLVNVKYTLLHPTSEEGLTGKGVPNSISI